VRCSLRTLMLAITGVGLLLALIVSLRVTPTVGHLLLVLAFAIPSGSYGYDIGGSSRSAVVGTVVGAIGGTIAISVFVLALDFWRLWM
jgi:hypothetical protein